MTSKTCFDDLDLDEIACGHALSNTQIKTGHRKNAASPKIRLRPRGFPRHQTTHSDVYLKKKTALQGGRHEHIETEI